MIMSGENKNVKELKSTNRKYKVYNFVENCRNENYNDKYEILPHKSLRKAKNWI